ncbi:PREDICTED: zinc finger CCCH domain-containing protein 4-like [Tarenaya hassleriana]|uniref:zinc finger CCCH domain-containing protein 4-like n=1 Tax=Tarenaya hassleriana TaxID=28532 RepID=UPI00053C49AB|nr:PREDICTED: zinc finger CCCH domain-containing protein 4-like [Tarenaya hassleriana]
MAHRILRDHEADGWERSDFPIICESCLGDNPYVRMTRADYDKECKICTRPFTVFRWRPGRDARYKKTEVCQTCCKLKNVCQVCLLDLEYGLPVQVRDTALNISSHDSIPKSDVNKEYFAEEHDRKTRAGLDYESSYGKIRPNDTILKLQRTTPYYKRNRAHICSFYIRGECTRGSECPYRHEMPETGELSQQNIKDRYYGVNDPVALKLLNKAGEMGTLETPEDESIKTLYIGGLNSRILEQDIRDQFYAYGEIESIRILPEKACAFVTYTTREGAEKAAEELCNKLVVNGQRLKVTWGRPQVPKSEPDGSDQAKQQAAVAHTGMLPRAVISQQQNQPPPMQYYMHPPPPHQDRPYYPSMDPQRMGALIPSQDGSSSTSENRGASSSHLMPQPPHGHYMHHPYPPPPYGYIPPPFQQYPPYHHHPSPMAHHGPPPGAQPYPLQPGPGLRPTPPQSSASAQPQPDSAPALSLSSGSGSASGSIQQEATGSGSSQ